MKISRASFYCSGLYFRIKCGGARQVTFINAEVIVESSSRKLPWRNLPSLGFYLSSSDSLLDVTLVFGLGRVLHLINSSRLDIHGTAYCQNGPINTGFVSTLWADVKWAQYPSYYT